jgi:hypothetical protein
MTKKQAYIAFALGAVLAVSSTAPAFAAENGANNPGMRKVAPRGEGMRQGDNARRASSTEMRREGRMASSTEMRRDGRMASSTKPARIGAEGNPGGVFDFGRDGGPITAGKVTAVNGTSFTIESITVRRDAKNKTVATSTVSFTVDASKAPVLKNKATTTVSSIVVGDAVIVKGKVSGTAIVAKAIIDVGTQGMPMRPGMMKGDREERGSTTASSTMPARPVGGEDRPKAPEVKKAGFFNRVGSFVGGWFK